jgi:protocatechuate 3,4-dioxygenase beta subunit
MYDRDDDEPVGRVLSRRDAVRLLGGGAAALLFLGGGKDAMSRRLAAQAPGRTPACVVRPEMTEGPFFVDKQLSRSDIREGRPGAPLAIALTVMDVTGGQCRPLPNAVVDVWQCDAKGVYSGVSDPMQGANTADQKFLRGFQTTGADGMAHFTTIYPGWYRGRTVHIHFKIRTQAPSGAFEFTSQWYFDEALNERILAGPDYARPGRRDTLNRTDSIYRNGGDQLLLAPTRNGDALASPFAIGLDLANADVGRADGFGRGGPGRGRRGR